MGNEESYAPALAAVSFAVMQTLELLAGPSVHSMQANREEVALLLVVLVSVQLLRLTAHALTPNRMMEGAPVVSWRWTFCAVWLGFDN